MKQEITVTGPATLSNSFLGDTTQICVETADFEACGRKMIQSGTWNGVRYAYFGTEDLIGTTIEIFDFPQAFVFPEPEAWFPARPRAGGA